MNTKFLVAFLFCLALTAFAEDKKAETQLPYLGPGTDKMSPEEYRKVYKEYIQQTILLGYPFIEGAQNPCDQALRTIFRQAGMYSYPVPQDSEHLERATRAVGGKNLEYYHLAGNTIQVLREGPAGILDRVFFVNTNSVKASRKIAQIAKSEALSLQRDPRTGLERVKNVPVGYPHLFLDPLAQGIYVRELKFNHSKDKCLPTEFNDNSWVGGFALDADHCTQVQKDVDNVWADKISPHEFAERERNRLKEGAVQSAMRRGLGRKEAEQLVAKHFTEPFVNDITVVGNGMRNLAQCNQLAIGGVVNKKSDAGSIPANGSGGDAAGTGSTK